jgi:hypothetical protein
MSSVDTINRAEREAGDTVSLRDFVDARSEYVRASIGNISVKDYVDSREKAIRDLYDSQFNNQREALNNTRAAMDKRLDGMNEFRQQINDMTAKFATREETSSTIKYLSDRVAVVESGLVTRQEQAANQVSLANQISTMQSRLTAIEAAKAGATEIKTEAKSDQTLVIAAIGVATAVLVAVVAWTNHPVQAPTSNYTITAPTSAPTPH